MSMEPTTTDADKAVAQAPLPRSQPSWLPMVGSLLFVALLVGLVALSGSRT